MAAYLVLMQEVDDVDRYRNEYLPRVRPFLQKYGAEFLVAGFDAEPAEGEPPNSTVVIRFADAKAAWGFLNDPDYQPTAVAGEVHAGENGPPGSAPGAAH